MLQTLCLLKKNNKQILQYGFCYKVIESSSGIATHIVSNSRTKCSYESFLCFSDGSSKIFFCHWITHVKKTPKFLFDTFHSKRVFTRHSLTFFFQEKCNICPNPVHPCAIFFTKCFQLISFLGRTTLRSGPDCKILCRARATKWIPTDKRRGPGATSKNQKPKGSL